MTHTPEDLPSPDEFRRKLAHVDREFADARRYLSALCAEDNQALGALMAEIHRSGRAMKVLAAMAVLALDFAHLSVDRLGGDVQKWLDGSAMAQDTAENERDQTELGGESCHRPNAAFDGGSIAGSAAQAAVGLETLVVLLGWRADPSHSVRRSRSSRLSCRATSPAEYFCGCPCSTTTPPHTRPRAGVVGRASGADELFGPGDRFVIFDHHVEERRIRHGVSLCRPAAILRR